MSTVDGSSARRADTPTPIRSISAELSDDERTEVEAWAAAQPAPDQEPPPPIRSISAELSDDERTEVQAWSQDQ